ncbi:MAG: NAD(P)/FAD-dependent oxidoreductase [Prevotellaceae bacterium]|jgi:uncharacterized FAD-dependent dehydrogenase|nr:NAD(P)/FAD-dependent oxidoreductase [Prevotellaceae bacterium]
MSGKEINISVSLETAADERLLRQAAAKAVGCPEDVITHLQLLRRSIDARRGTPLLQLKLQIYTGDASPPPPPVFNYQNVTGKPPVIIVGAGPAGLFAALKLLEKGLKPVILERGKAVNERKYDIAKLTREQIVNPNSNWCFGEGGAGTYSDGKLYTRSNKRGNIGHILQQLVLHGANPDILVDANAHIGTDKLPQIIANIRKTIIAHGGEYYFDTQVNDMIVKNGEVLGVKTIGGTSFEGVAVILATGHSARDIYELFDRKGWVLEAKAFAMGVRAEHPQALINHIQYRGAKGAAASLLPAAAYSLVTQVEGRGVFSFCMCPGGIMVPAATAPGEVVVNGMSNSLRNSPYANAGIVVQVSPADYGGNSALDGLYFQHEIERRMFVAANNSQRAPAQRLVDFMNKKTTAAIQKTSYIHGVTAAPLHELLPDFINNSLWQAFRNFDKKMHGYLSNEAMLVAVESRTSSPMRIPRDSLTLEHIQLKHLYPCGEGAGYAGGITSSAIDGVNCAEKVVKRETSYGIKY